MSGRTDIRGENKDQVFALYFFLHYYFLFFIDGERKKFNNSTFPWKHYNTLLNLTKSVNNLTILHVILIYIKVVSLSSFG